MKRAISYKIGTPFFQTNKLPDYFNNVGAVHHFLYARLKNHRAKIMSGDLKGGVEVFCFVVYKSVANSY
jgi:hypothetical protein